MRISDWSSDVCSSDLATLYHAGAKGVGVLDSLGCKVVAMRTVAVDKKVIPRHSILFIKETVGMKMPDGSTHDGDWYGPAERRVGKECASPDISLCGQYDRTKK